MSSKKRTDFYNHPLQLRTLLEDRFSVNLSKVLRKFLRNIFSERLLTNFQTKFNKKNGYHV